MSKRTRKKQPAELGAGTAHPLVTLTLSQDASNAVHLYRNRTGREVHDIVNASLAEVANVNRMLEEPECVRDDSPEILIDQIEETARLRMRLDGEVSQKVSTSPTPNLHTVTINLTPEAHAALMLLAKYDGYDSVTDAFLGMAVGEIKALFNQVLGSSDDHTLAEWFGIKPDDEEPEGK